MTDKAKPLPAEIEIEIGRLISQLTMAGWAISASQYEPDSFGGWHVDLCRNGLVLRLVRDRSQYFVDQMPTEEIKSAGLWKAFNSVDEFQNAVIGWQKITSPAD